MSRILPLLIIVFVYIRGGAQYVEYSLNTGVETHVFSGPQNPFWFQMNREGRIAPKSNSLAWVNGHSKFYTRSEEFVTVGLGAHYKDDAFEDVELEEYFIGFENDQLSLVLGKKMEEDYYNGLSATNLSILWSANAAPIPGARLRLKKPLMLWNETGLGILFSWEEYFSDEKNRYIQKPRIHHKSFHLVWHASRSLDVILGVQHYVMWAGKSPEYGDLPSSFNDYLKVISGGSLRGGTGVVGENEINGLGNHLGGYEAKIKTSISHYDVQFIYNTIFEDLSGIKWRNKPDGRYGIFIEDRENQKWIESAMYEYYFTRHQSKTYPTTDGKDDYFNNHLYRSGWTYGGRVIGLPFILVDQDEPGIEHNNIVAHHLGLSGQAFYQYPYKFLISYRGNYGVKSGSITPVFQVISTFVDVVLWERQFKLNLLFGGDFHFEDSNNIGFGLRLSKEFF